MVRDGRLIATRMEWGAWIGTELDDLVFCRAELVRLFWMSGRLASLLCGSVEMIRLFWMVGTQGSVPRMLYKDSFTLPISSLLLRYHLHSNQSSTSYDIYWYYLLEHLLHLRLSRLLKHSTSINLYTLQNVRLYLHRI